ncbi:hypothetical protein [Nitrosomonas oligotropha]|uniref:hypothetical protein n=1 Tax=Nitrosomonas oligotropha TaxID=42354 RepID=UPI001371D64D|nr:hypothetical protein [Nitrosomonas oligotropha]MXS81580.1 hypothetical protein [Nitrosomonas oligotropha]
MIAGQLEIQLMANMARLVSDMDRAKRTVGNAVDTMNKVLGTIGVGLSLAGIASLVKGVADVGDKLNDLRKITGMTVNELGGLDKMAKLNGSDLDTVAKAVGIMSKNMSAGERVFSLMGITIKDTNGKLRDSNQVFLEVADKFSRYQDGAAKSALANELFGKGGRDLIPLLDEGRAKLEEAAEAHRKYSGFTDESAQESDRFNDTIEMLKGRVSSLGNNFVVGLLPALSDVGSAFLQTTSYANAFNKAGEYAGIAFKMLTIGAVTSYNVLLSFGTAIDGIIKQVVALTNLDLRKAIEIGNDYFAKIDNNAKATAEFVRTIKYGDQALQDAAESQRELNNQQLLAPPTLEKIAAAQKETVTEAQRFIDALQKEARETGITGTALTRLRAEYLGVSDAAEAYIQEIERKNRAARIEEMNTQQIVKNLERYKKLTEETQTAQEKYQDQVKYINEARNATDGTAISQETYNRALQKAQEEFKKAGETGKTAMNDLDQYTIQAARNIQNAFANFLFDPFQDGVKGMLGNFLNAIRRMVAEVAASRIANAIGLNGLLGIGGTAAAGAAGTGSGGGLNLLNIASLGSSVMSGIRGGFGIPGFIGNMGMSLPGSVGSFFGGMAGKTATQAAAEAGAMALWGSSGATAGIASGMGAGLAAAAGPLMVAFAATQAFKMLAGDKRMGGGFGKFMNTIGDIPILGDFIPVVPLLNSLFGRGPLKQQGTLLQGQIGAEGFESGMLQTRFKAKGGLFRSDKIDFARVDAMTGETWTDNRKLQGFADDLAKAAQEVFGLINDTTSKTSASLREIGKDLGLSTEGIDKFGYSINILSDKGKMLTEEQIGKEIENITDGLARSLLPQVDELAKRGETALQTVSRLGTEFTSLVDAASLILGKSSADARAMISGTSFAGRTAFVDAAGGTDALGQKAAFFSQNFFTSTELLTQSQARLDEQLQSLGLSSDLTKDQFRGLVQSFGQVGGISEDLLQSLLNLAPAFVSVRAAEEQLAEQQRQQAAQVQQQRLGLETQLLQLQGNTVELRRRELEALDPANRALQENIFALIDQQAAAQSSAEAIKNSLSDAFTVLQRSVAQEKTRITDAYNKAIAESQKHIDDVTGSISKLKSLSDALKSTTDALRPIGLMQARAQIQDAIANAKNGIFPDAAGIGQALSALSNQNTDRFASRFDFLSSRAQSAGLVDQLGALTANKMTDEQRMLETLQSSKDALTDGFNVQIAQLDGLITSAQQQIDIMNGTYFAIKSVGDAIGDLNRALLQAGAGTIGDGHVSGNPAISNQAIADYFKSARTPDEIFRDVSKYGVSSSQIMGATGYTQEQVDKFFADNPRIPRFATGSSYVPRTGPAIVHQGERIINPQQNGDIVDSLKTVARKTEENTNAINNLYRLVRNTVQETTTGFALTTTPA